MIRKMQNPEIVKFLIEKAAYHLVICLQWDNIESASSRYEAFIASCTLLREAESLSCGSIGGFDTGQDHPTFLDRIVFIYDKLKIPHDKYLKECMEKRFKMSLGI